MASVHQTESHTSDGACFDDYMQYVNECTRCDSDEAVDDLDASTPSEWRAAAKSPLRGTAKRTTGAHRLTLRRSSASPLPLPSVSERIKPAFQASLGNQVETMPHREGTVMERAQCLLLDVYACVGQRPNRMFSISADGLEWITTAACRDALSAVSNTGLRMPMEYLTQEILCMGSQFLRVELAVESLHPAKLVRPEESFVIERWTADGILEHGDSNGGVSSAPSASTTLVGRRPLSSYEALRRASYMSMVATHRLLRRMLDSVAHDLLRRQEAQCNAWRPPSTFASRAPPHQRQMPEGDEENDCSDQPTVPMLLSAMQQIRRELRSLMLPIGRVEQLLEASGFAVAPKASVPPPVDVEEASALWIDALASSYGALQATSCCGVGPNHHGTPSMASMVFSLLTVAVWPWLETFAWIIVGAVPHIDEASWAQRCPTLFAARFEMQEDPSHTATGSSQAPFPATPSSDQSAVSIAAACEGIVRHQSWRNVRLGQQQAVRSVLSEVQDALMGDAATQRAAAAEERHQLHSKNARATTAPLLFTAGCDVYRVVCSYDALDVGVQCEPFRSANVEEDQENLEVDAGSAVPLQVNFGIPAASWVPRVVLHPLAREATRSQEHFVRELLVKPLAAKSPVVDAMGIQRSAHLCATFQESLEAIFHCALFEGLPSTGVAFVERVAALPSQWWVGTPQLLASAFREACGAAEWDDATTASSTTAAAGGSQRHLGRGRWSSLVVDGPKPNEPAVAAHTGGLLQVLQSARLVWAFPEQHAVILLPHLYYGGAEGQVGDAYSRIFRLLTSLLLVKQGLLRLWKDQRWAMSGGGTTDDRTGGSGGTASTYSSAAMHLAFVVNTLIDFVFSEVRVASAALREAVSKERHRVSNVCRAVDDFISHVDVVSLQSVAVRSSEGSHMMHQSIVGILRLSLDLCSAAAGGGGIAAAVSMDVVASRTKSAVSRLLAAIRSVPSGSPLCSRIRPLLLQLTFNRFFSDE